MRRRVALVLTFILIFTCIEPVNASAFYASNSENVNEFEAEENLCGCEPIEAIQVDESDILTFCTFTVYSEYPDELSRDWSQYSNYYCYASLNENEKKLYNDLEQLCEHYISSTDDMNQVSYTDNTGQEGVKYTIGASYNDISIDRLQEIIFIFIYQNPQYYFLANMFLYSSKTVWITVYDEFADGEARAEVTETFFDKIDAWSEDISSKSTTYAKEKEIHDIVCKHTGYIRGEYDQSAYSAVMQEKTVCAGYTKMFSILANGNGVDTVSVTSSDHAWNIVKLGDSWYNVDTTWDDQSYGIIYDYFNKSDDFFREDSSHIPESHYLTIIPTCNSDYNEKENENKTVNVTGVQLDRNEATIDLDTDINQVSLNAIVTPKDSTDSSVIWTSSDYDVAVVSDEGVVTAVAPGIARIEAETIDGGYKAYCDIHVYKSYDKPSAPIYASRTENSITLELVDGCVYSMDKVNWQESVTFEGLLPDTEYVFYVKKVANGYYKESEVSSGTTVRTKALENIEENKKPTTEESATEEEITEEPTTEEPATEEVPTEEEPTTEEATTEEEITEEPTTEEVPTEEEPTTEEATTEEVPTTEEPTTEEPTTEEAPTEEVPTTEEAPTEEVPTTEEAPTEEVPTTEEAPTEEVPTTEAPTTEEVPTTEEPTTEVPTTEAPTTEKPTAVPSVNVTYRTHVQSYGWQAPVSNGSVSGTIGKGKRLEGIEIRVSGNKQLGVKYRTHVQSYGWQSYVADGKMSGTSGEGKRLEAINIELTGKDKDKYDIYYRVHAQSYGWLGWAKNGELAGTSGQGKRLEAIEIKVVKKGEKFNGLTGYSYVEVGKNANNSNNAGMINYMTHVQSYGDQSYVYDGSVSGTFGEAKRLEGIRINVNNAKTNVSGGIRYKTHVQTYAWLDWSSNGAFNGTHGESKRLEAIKIELTGEMSKKYDVYYRVHAQTYGWLGWAKNGEAAGTAGLAKRLEGIQIVIIPKGSMPPGATSGAYISASPNN